MHFLLIAKTLSRHGLEEATILVLGLLPVVGSVKLPYLSAKLSCHLLYILGERDLTNQHQKYQNQSKNPASIVGRFHTSYAILIFQLHVVVTSVNAINHNRNFLLQICPSEILALLSNHKLVQ